MNKANARLVAAVQEWGGLTTEEWNATPETIRAKLVAAFERDFELQPEMINFDGQEFERLSILAKREYPESDPQYHVYGWSTYPESSVLAGQAMKCWLDSFDSIDEAKAKFPQAELSHALLEPRVSLNHLPGENDFVPGGAYPDDV